MCSIKTLVIEFENEITWSAQSAGRAFSAPFSWATCHETKEAALPRGRDQGEGLHVEWEEEGILLFVRSSQVKSSYYSPNFIEIEPFVRVI